MNPVRKFLTLPPGLAKLGAIPLSRGECLRCNEPADVYQVPERGPIILHSGEVCAGLLEQCSVPGATKCADQHGFVQE